MLIEPRPPKLNAWGAEQQNFFSHLHLLQLSVHLLKDFKLLEKLLPAHNTDRIFKICFALLNYPYLVLLLHYEKYFPNVRGITLMASNQGQGKMAG